MTQVLERNIQVMEKNNEYLRHRLLMDGGKHQGAFLHIQNSTLSAGGTLNLQRVDKEKPSNMEQHPRDASREQREPQRDASNKEILI